MSLDEMNLQFPALVPAQEEFETEPNEPDELESAGLAVARHLERTTESQGRVRRLEACPHTTNPYTRASSHADGLAAAAQSKTEGMGCEHASNDIEVDKDEIKGGTKLAVPGHTFNNFQFPVISRSILR